MYTCYYCHTLAYVIVEYTAYFSNFFIDLYVRYQNKLWRRFGLFLLSYDTLKVDSVA